MRQFPLKSFHITVSALARWGKDYLSAFFRQICMFALQLSTSNFNFSACGLFNIDSETILKVGRVRVTEIACLNCFTYTVRNYIVCIIRNYKLHDTALGKTPRNAIKKAVKRCG